MEDPSTDTTALLAAQQLIHRAAHLLDGGRWAEYVACFTESGSMARPSDPANPIVGRQAIRESLEARPPRRSAHILTNTYVTDVTAQSMTATSRALLFTGPANGDPSGSGPAPADNAVVVGTFVDRLVLEGRSWLFASRQGSLELKAAWG
jgi:hypothetical protein